MVEQASVKNKGLSRLQPRHLLTLLSGATVPFVAATPYERGD